MRKANLSLPFLALGTSFIALGLTVQRVFLFIGIAFIVIAALGLVRSRR